MDQFSITGEFFLSKIEKVWSLSGDKEKKNLKDIILDRKYEPLR